MRACVERASERASERTRSRYTDKSFSLSRLFSSLRFSRVSLSFFLALFILGFYRRDTARPLYIVGVLISAPRQCSAARHSTRLKTNLFPNYAITLVIKFSVAETLLGVRVCVCMYGLLLRVGCILRLCNSRKVDTRSIRTRERHECCLVKRKDRQQL